MITSQQADFLGMSSQEKKICNVLSKTGNSLTATDIAISVNEPRTTVNFYLRKLLKKGWVQNLKTPGFPYRRWHIVENNVLKNNFANLLNISNSTITPLTVTEGLKKVIEAYEKIIDIDVEKRVFIIQGNLTPKFCSEKLSDDLIKKIHLIQKEKELVLEGITSRKTLSLFEEMSVEMLQSHYGRLSVAYIIPDEFLDFDEEIYIFQEKIIIIQLATEKALLLEDKNTAYALCKLIFFIEQYAEKVDINKYIKGIIEKKQKA